MKVFINILGLIAFAIVATILSLFYSGFVSVVRDVLLVDYLHAEGKYAYLIDPSEKAWRELGGAIGFFLLGCLPRFWGFIVPATIGILVIMDTVDQQFNDLQTWQYSSIIFIGAVYGILLGLWGKGCWKIGKKIRQAGRIKPQGE